MHNLIFFTTLQTYLVRLARSLRAEDRPRRAPERLPSRLGSQVIAVSVLLSIGLVADAADHFVRQDARGAGDGADWTNAFTSLPPDLIRGDTYYVADGIYPGYTFDDSESASRLITIKKATVTDHGTEAGWDNSYGDGQAEFAPSLTFNTGYYVIDGVVGGGPDVWANGSDDDGSSYGIRVVSKNLGGDKLIRPNASNLTIKHVDLSYDASDSLSFPSPGSTGSQDAIYGVASISDLTISHCRFNSAGRTALLSRATWSNITIEYCFFRDVTIGTHAGMHGEVWSAGNNNSSNFHIRHNFINTDRGAGSTGGFIVAGVNGLYVYGNVFADSGQANGIISNWTSGPETVNVFLYNNTFIDCDIRLGFSSMTDITSLNNTFYNCSLSWFHGTHGHSHTSVNLGEATQQLIESDPFVNSTAIVPDVHLISGTSPGLSLSAPYHIDLNGNTRGNDGTWDRGTFEYTGSGSPRPAPPLNLIVN